MSIKRALVVDDSMSARLKLRMMLEQNSISVDMAASGEEALEYLKKKKPDLVFMDHIMPGMSGFDAAKAISQGRETSSIPVVMYTSKEGDSYLADARAHGAVGILPKPPTKDSLARVIAEVTGAPAPAVAPRPSAPPPAAARPAAAPAGPAVSQEMVEKMARAAAEAAVKRMLDEQLAAFRRDMMSNIQTSAKQAASEALQQGGGSNEDLHKQIEELRGQIKEAHTLDPQVAKDVMRTAREAATQAAGDAAQDTAHKVARLAAQNVAEQTATVAAQKAAGELFQNRSQELMNELNKRLQQDLNEIRLSVDALKTLDPSVLEDVKDVARHSAVQAAQEAATKTAKAAAQQAGRVEAEQVAATAATRVVDNLLRSQLSRLYMIAGAGMVIGGMALALILVL